MSEASPRFRQDLATSPVEADGVACVDVSDPSTGNSFRLYDFEYQLALQLNGQPVDDVVSWASQAYGAELTADGLKEFASRLRELGFLEADVEVVPGRPASDAVATLEIPIPKLPEPEDAGDNGADEWMAAQSAQTAQFVPNKALLDEPEATIVAPQSQWFPDAGKPAAGKPPAPAAPRRPITGESSPPMSSDDLVEEPPSPRREAHGVGRPTPNWALALDGDLPSGGAAQAAEKPADLSPQVTLPPVLTPTVAPPPPGVSERRQPPQPEAVVMAAFTGDEAGRPRPAARKSRAPLIVVGLLVAGAAIAAGVWYWKNQRPAPAPQAVRVHVLTPAPAAVYRWFDRPGQVTTADMLALSFSNPGRLTELLPSGTEVAAGEVVGKLQAAAPIETALEHHRSRAGFYKQVRDAMRAVGNDAAAHHAEVMLAEKERLVAEAQAALARYTVAASEPGEIVETLAKVGSAVTPGVPVARIKSRLLRGAFQLTPTERAAFSGAGFCRVEVIGLAPRASNEPVRRAGPPSTAFDSSPLEAQVGPRFVDCERLPARSTADPVLVALPGDVGLVSGQPLRLARRRFDAVFPVPATALQTDGDRRALWVAARNGTSEPRDVVLADEGDQALVSDGLRVGDQVIVDPPADLHAGARVAIEP